MSFELALKRIQTDCCWYRLFQCSIRWAIVRFYPRLISTVGSIWHCVNVTASISFWY